MGAVQPYPYTTSLIRFWQLLPLRLSTLTCLVQAQARPQVFF